MNLSTWNDRRVFRVICFLAVFLALGIPTASPALTESTTLRQMMDEAEYIVVATCIGQSTHFDASGARVFTVSRFDVEKTISGAPALQDLSLRVLGGTRDGLVVDVPGAPRFGEGHKYLLFVTKPFENGFRTTVGWKQGVFEVVKPSATEPELITSSPGQTEVFDRELKTVRNQEKANISGLTLAEVETILGRQSVKKNTGNVTSKTAVPEAKVSRQKP